MQFIYLSIYHSKGKKRKKKGRRKTRQEKRKRKKCKNLQRVREGLNDSEICKV